MHTYTLYYYPQLSKSENKNIWLVLVSHKTIGKLFFFFFLIFCPIREFNCSTKTYALCTIGDNALYTVISSYTSKRTLGR